jgi:hypothetical protein
MHESYSLCRVRSIYSLLVYYHICYWYSLLVYSCCLNVSYSEQHIFVSEQHIVVSEHIVLVSHLFALL